MDEEKILRYINSLFGENKGKISLIQEPIDVKLQLEYLKYSSKIEHDFIFEDIIIESEKLFNNEENIDTKKDILVKLASFDKPEAFRCIEKYCKNPDSEVESWAKIALNESRSVIESSLLDTAPVVISTGMGGKGTNFRFFVAFSHKKKACFTLSQQDIIEKEVTFQITQNNGELESIEFEKELVGIIINISFDSSLKNIFDSIVGECNLFGNFISKSYLITNLKKLSFDEIRQVYANPESNIFTNNTFNEDFISNYPKPDFLSE